MSRAGIKIALIDSGVATSHKQLTSIDHGIDLKGGENDPGADFMGTARRARPHRRHSG